MDLRRRFYNIIIIVFLLAVLLALYLCKDFLMSLLLSVFLAYILYPVYAYLIQITGKRRVSSALSLAVVFIFLTVIILILFVTALNEASRLLESGEAIIQHAGKLSDELTSFSYRYLPDHAASYIGHLPSAILDWALPILSAWLSIFIGNIPILFAHAVLIIFFTYYILVEGKRLLTRFLNYIPEKVIIRMFLSQLDDIYTGLFHVLFITAGITGALGAVGLYLLGVPFPLLWGIIIALAMLLPLLGPATVLWPMTIYYALVGNYVMAVILAVFNLLVLTIIPENIIRPRLALKGARVHPVITILAFTAPLFVIGVYGVILGPAVFGFVLAGYRTLSYMEKI